VYLTAGTFRPDITAPPASSINSAPADGGNARNKSAARRQRVRQSARADIAQRLQHHVDLLREKLAAVQQELVNEKDRRNAISLMLEADEAGGGMRALPAAVPAHALLQGPGRGYRGLTAAVHAALSRRATGSARPSSKQGATPRTSRASWRAKGHLDRDRGTRGRDDFVSAERPWLRVPGAGVHADSVSRALPRDIRGIWHLSGGGTSKLGATFIRFF
jgi:hypothetical protein